jgi:hypothetical protein
MLLGVLLAVALGATLALSGWLFRHVEGAAVAATNVPKAETAVRPGSRALLAAERPRPSNRHIRSLLLSYSLLRSGQKR